MPYSNQVAQQPSFSNQMALADLTAIDLSA